MEHFVANHNEALRNREIPAFEVAYNSPVGSPVSQTMETRLSEGQGPGYPWLRLLNRKPYLSHPSMHQDISGSYFSRRVHSGRFMGYDRHKRRQP